MPDVVTFSPRLPGSTRKPLDRSASSTSDSIRCTCRRFCCIGFRATRDRCLTVTPACASPSTPRPSMRRRLCSVVLLNVCSSALATATISPGTSPFLPQVPLFAALREDARSGSGDAARPHRGPRVFRPNLELELRLQSAAELVGQRSERFGRSIVSTLCVFPQVIGLRTVHGTCVRKGPGLRRQRCGSPR